MDSIINDNQCCFKNNIKVNVFRYSGTYLSDKATFAICMNVFILHLITIDIILRTNIISAFCKLILEPYLYLIVINGLINSIKLMLLLNIIIKIKILINDFNCICD